MLILHKEKKTANKEKKMNDVIDSNSKMIAGLDLSWDKLSGKVVLITGATGFIGSSIINALMSRNMIFNTSVKIIALVRSVTKANKIFEEYIESPLFEFLESDVCNPLFYEGDIDFIIHCASNAAPSEYDTDPVGTMLTNFLGTTNLLQLAKEKKVENFLYTSTIEVYGTTSNIDKIKEDDFGYIDSTNPRSCYPISKKACETLCISYAKQFGVPVSIGRLSYIFGPGMKKNDSKIVSILAREAAKKNNLVLKSKGEQLRSYTYISDAVSALIKLLTDGETMTAYNISSSLCVTTIANIAYTLADIYKDDKLEVVFDLAITDETKKFSPIQNAVLDNSRIKAIGWKETTDLKKGLKKMVESMMHSEENN